MSKLLVIIFIMASILSTAYCKLTEVYFDLNVQSTHFTNDEGFINRDYLAVGLGDGKSPPLTWENVPEETQELIIIMQSKENPDKALWFITGIPPDTKGISRGGDIPGATEVWPYTGPNPDENKDPGNPKTYTYTIYVYALLQASPPNPPSSTQQIKELLDAEAISSGSITGKYIMY